MTGRACHALEINPAYCDVTIERWQNFTGEKAKLVDGYNAEDDFARSIDRVLRRHPRDEKPPVGLGGHANEGKTT